MLKIKSAQFLDDFDGKPDYKSTLSPRGQEEWEKRKSRPTDFNDDSELEDDFDKCSSCGKTGEPGEVQDRYSFGFPAGHLCEDCCKRFKDNCGLKGDQGDPRTLHEFETGGYDALYGET